MIVSTHLVEDVAAACTDVTLIEAGRIAYRSTTRELTELGGTGDGGAEQPDGNPIERGYTAALRAHRAGVANR